MSYLELDLKTRNDWENYFPRVSRASAIQGVVGATLLVGVVVLSGCSLTKVLCAHEGQPTLPALWYVFLPISASIFLPIVTGVKTASAYSHAPPAMRDDRDALATVLWTTARVTVKLTVAIGVLMLLMLLTLWSVGDGRQGQS
jgi:hypothetical protein